MDLQNSFVVPSDIDTAWKQLQDVEGLAPCMPGATLTSHDGDDFTGSVKVKLGPVSMVFAGQARFVSKDEATHTMVIEGSGKETKGSGTAKGMVTAVLVAEAPDRTRVDRVVGRYRDRPDHGDVGAFGHENMITDLVESPWRNSSNARLISASGMRSAMIVSRSSAPRM